MGAPTVYGLGVTLFELLTREHMFKAESSEAMMAQDLSGKRGLARGVLSNVSPDIDSVLGVATVPERYISSAAFASDSTSWLEGVDVWEPILYWPEFEDLLAAVNGQ
ncbi:MAG: hypothetical protein ACI841_003806 [Planctomycetota bacterium]|jgi:hypothetical protein